MLKRFYECLRIRINTDRRLGYRQKDEIIIWNQRGHDFLTIFRTRPNSYNVRFDAHNTDNSWMHEDAPLRLVALAIASWDGGTDMFGNPFHDEKNGTFEY